MVQIFDDAVKTFIENNKINNSKEKYVKNFKKKFGYFMAQKPIKDDKEIGNFFLESIKKYDYYSREKVEGIFRNFHNNYLMRQKDITLMNTRFSNISSINEPYKYNSSEFFLAKYIEVNELGNNQKIDLYSLKKVKETNQKMHEKLSNIKYIVLIDDFSGTGNTIIEYLTKIECYLKDRITIIFCIHIMGKAEEKITNFAQERGLIIFLKFFKKTFNELDDKSDLRNKIKELETNISSPFPLGYDESEALVTFYRNCPNNTFSSYWYHYEGYWTALFPRANIEPFDNHQKGMNNIAYNLAVMGIKDYDIKVIITLIYLNKYGVTSEKFELSRILGYNNRQLQEHYKKLTQDKWIVNRGTLSDKGRIYLRDMQIERLSISDLVKDPTNLTSDDGLELSDPYIPQ